MNFKFQNFNLVGSEGGRLMVSEGVCVNLKKRRKEKKRKQEMKQKIEKERKKGRREEKSIWF